MRNSSGPRARRARSALGIVVLTAAAASAAPPQPERVVYRVDPSRAIGRIPVGIHGQFLEHIFNSVHGGLWGDLVRNPSLEATSAGAWVVEGDTVRTTDRVTDRRLVFGDERWGDYDISLEARKTAGSEGFIVLFRVQSPVRFYWANLGGWQNREHGFEKARGPLGTRVRGSIEEGRWYRVRIRCEGPRFEVWLDGRKALDATDDRDPILSGAVGLTGWDSAVEFRSLRVTTLDGRPLHEGPPPRTALVEAPPYWRTFGAAEFENDPRGPRTGRASLRIRRTEAGGEAGVRQGPIALREGESYRGSLFLRGAGGGRVEVRLAAADGTVVSRGSLTPAGAEWRRETFELASPRAVDDGALEIALAGAGDVGIDMVSLFPASSLEAGGFRPDVLEAVQALRPASIRYPGGCFASAYRWKDAIGPREDRTYYPNVIWDDQDPNQMGTDEFMDLCRHLGAEPIIAINIAAGVEEAFDWLEYCNGEATTPWGARRARNGHPEPYGVKLWEIDNETWGMGAERYAAEVIRFGRALRARDPSIRIIACGGYGYDDGKGGTHGWNETLLARAARDFDYLSIHYYNGIMYAQDHVGDPRRYEAYMRDEIGGLIARSDNPSIRIYCSEWGMMNDEWRSGLYTGGILNAFERQGELVTMACPAVWLQTVSESRPRPRWASCSILFDHRKTYGAPTWVVQKLWREHFAPTRVGLEGPERPLDTIATLSEDGDTLYIKSVNPTAGAVEVSVDVGGGFDPQRASLRLVSAAEGDRNTLEDPESIAPREGEARLEGGRASFTMPPLSAGVLVLAKEALPGTPAPARAELPRPRARIRIDLGEEKAPVSPDLYGIFMEEISHAFDGGIYAELIRNRSFEEGVLPPGMKLVERPEGGLKMELASLPEGVPPERWDMPWPWMMNCGWDPGRALIGWSLLEEGGARGTMALTEAHPMNPASSRSLAMTVSPPASPGGRVGLVNEGYWGIDVDAEVSYRLRLHLRPETFAGELTASLETREGKALARHSFGRIEPAASWRRLEAALVAEGTDPRARLVLSFRGEGALQVDWVSLFPPTYKGRENGLRIDLARYLEALQPAFVRYPGGCYVEGLSWESAPDWRRMVCPPEERPGMWGYWQYRSSDGFGYHEFLELCEDIGADAMYVAFCGMTVHPDNNMPLERIGPVIQQTLDAIEYALGPVDSRWGAVRASMGHPAPFPLKYVEIGNEHPPAIYGEYYRRFREAIKAVYPDITVIMSMYWSGLNRPAIERAGDENIDMVDEHSYRGSGWVRTNFDYFDRYERKPWKVYVGEYAHHHGSGDFSAAMDDSVYLMMLERNGDLVKLASYAPLFANVNKRDWGVNLIEFDSSRSFAHASYHVQQVFSRTRPDVNLATTVEIAPPPDPDRPLLAGRFGLGAWNTLNEFKELRIHDGEGHLVFADDFASLEHWDAPERGAWKAEGGVLSQTELGHGPAGIFLERPLETGRVTVKARRVGGQEGFLIFFNADGLDRYMFCNYGAAGNRFSAIQGTPAEGLATQGGGDIQGPIEDGRWYEIGLNLEKDSAEMTLDGKRVGRIEAVAQPAFFATAGWDRDDGRVVLRATNYHPIPVEATIELAGAATVGPDGRRIALRADRPSDENSLDEPYRILPQESRLEGCAATFPVTLPPRSVNVLLIPATPPRLGSLLPNPSFEETLPGGDSGWTSRA